MSGQVPCQGVVPDGPWSGKHADLPVVGNTLQECLWVATAPLVASEMGFYGVLPFF